MPHKVERWRCDFCKRKTYKHKTDIVKHEATCFDNPARKSCRTCAWESFDQYGDEFENDNGPRSCAHEDDFLTGHLPKNAWGSLFDSDPNIRWNCWAYEPKEE